MVYKRNITIQTSRIIGCDGNMEDLCVREFKDDVMLCARIGMSNRIRIAVYTRSGDTKYIWSSTDINFHTASEVTLRMVIKHSGEVDSDRDLFYSYDFLKTITSRSEWAEFEATFPKWLKDDIELEICMNELQK